MLSKAFVIACAQLPMLTQSELEQVRARAGILLQAGGAKRQTTGLSQSSEARRDAEEDIDLILSEIAGHLRDQGVEYASVPMLRRVSNYASFAEKVPATMIYFRKVTTNRTKLRAMIRVAITLLYADLMKMNLSATTRTMMSHWHRIPAVMNKNFPGYARAGLLGLIIREPLKPSV